MDSTCITPDSNKFEMPGIEEFSPPPFLTETTRALYFASLLVSYICIAGREPTVVVLSRWSWLSSI